MHREIYVYAYMCTPGYSSQGKNKAKPTCLSTHSSYCSYFLSVVFVLCLSVLFSLSLLPLSHFVRRFLVNSLENSECTAVLFCTSLRLPFPLHTIVAIQMSKNKNYILKRERKKTFSVATPLPFPAGQTGEKKAELWAMHCYGLCSEDLHLILLCFFSINILNSMLN